MDTLTQNFKSYATKILMEALNEVFTSIKKQIQERISPVSGTFSSEATDPRELSRSKLETLIMQTKTNSFTNKIVSEKATELETKKNNLPKLFLQTTSLFESEENKASFIINTSSNSNAKTSQRSFDNNSDTAEAVQIEETTANEHLLNFRNACNTVSKTITAETGHEYE